MAVSKAATVEDYLKELPPERAELLGRVRDLVNSALPGGFVERMNWGMISWEVPLDAFSRTYNGQPLLCVALAAQKSYCALYLNCAHISCELNLRLREAYRAAGRKLDMGKSCLRFRKWDDLHVAALTELLGQSAVARVIADYEAGQLR